VDKERRAAGKDIIGVQAVDGQVVSSGLLVIGADISDGRDATIGGLDWSPGLRSTASTKADWVMS
jgi:hypothetical protein